jgi:hypothetical protein
MPSEKQLRLCAQVPKRKELKFSSSAVRALFSNIFFSQNKAKDPKKPIDLEKHGVVFCYLSLKTVDIKESEKEHILAFAIIRNRLTRFLKYLNTKKNKYFTKAFLSSENIKLL